MNVGVLPVESKLWADAPLPPLSKQHPPPNVTVQRQHENYLDEEADAEDQRTKYWLTSVDIEAHRPFAYNGAGLVVRNYSAFLSYLNTCFTISSLIARLVEQDDFRSPDNSVLRDKQHRATLYLCECFGLTGQKTTNFHHSELGITVLGMPFVAVDKFDKEATFVFFSVMPGQKLRGSFKPLLLPSFHHPRALFCVAKV